MNNSASAFSTIYSSLNYTHSSGNMAKRPLELPLALRMTHGVIASLAVLSNLVLCIVLWRKRHRMLKKPYHILIMSLAVADLLTGFVMFFATRMVLGSGQLPAHSGLLAEVYCRLFAFRFMLFVFGRGSVLTVMCLAVERWVSIVKPLYFKTSFSTRRVYAYLALIWGVSFFVRFDKFYTARASGTRCYRVSIMNKEEETILIIVYLLITFFIPMIITWSAFLHIWILLRKVHWTKARGVTAKKRLVRMCAVTVLLMTICWFPASISLLVWRFVDGGNVRETVQKSFWTLAMFNSCCNPTVYYFTNKEYRREINNLLCSLCWCYKHRSLLRQL